MRDRFGREIRYLRVSVTDGCNLRCRYCRPAGAAGRATGDALSWEELLRLCRLAVSLHLARFKVTGGEPLTRRGCAGFIRALKALPGVEQVTLTTNGLLLLPALEELADAGLDGVNVSLDTLDSAQYAALTGCAQPGAVARLRETLEACRGQGLNTKVNAVLLRETEAQWPALAALAENGVDVRFIELMPLGPGASLAGASSREALAVLRRRWPDLRAVEERRGNGPARYFQSASLKGRVGLIDAMSHMFCESCNRVRLTCAGLLKPCLCYGAAADLRALLRGGASDEAIREAMAQAILAKPPAHCFQAREGISEHRSMNEIGG